MKCINYGVCKPIIIHFTFFCGQTRCLCELYTLYIVGNQYVIKRKKNLKMTLV